MDRWIVALLVGLLGGVGGALAVNLLLPPKAAAPEGGSEAGSALATQLARLEPALRALESSGPTLEGAPLRAGAAGVPLDAAQMADLRKAVREELATVIDQRIDKLKPAGGEAAAPAARRESEKKRVSLADASRALDLSASEEDALRRIYAESQEKMMRLVAGDGGDVEAVRREVDEARRDPKKRQGLVFKYMPKMLPKLGEFIQVGMEQEAAIAEAVGPDKAERLQREFDVEEANPLGVGGEMRVNARADGR